ncbi:hypothetical protein SD457_22270 [Coprobacillaceae bacterium CR2/5/TPMF4]|nr:hypothetical protein SD457_22270 [Coprobacillaceae bacterium CR2/5/TPMF4]
MFFASHFTSLVVVSFFSSSKTYASSPVTTAIPEIIVLDPSVASIMSPLFMPLTNPFAPSSLIPQLILVLLWSKQSCFTDGLIVAFQTTD